MSNFLSLNLKDFGKGLLLAVLTAVLGLVYTLLKDKGFDLTGADLQEILKVALIAFLGYITKNFLSNNEGQFGRADK
jgi:hypothetical protein